MKPTTKTVKKLNLNRETIRTLDSLRILAPTELAAVLGGQPPATSNYDEACSGSGQPNCRPG